MLQMSILIFIAALVEVFKIVKYEEVVLEIFF